MESFINRGIFGIIGKGTMGNLEKKLKKIEKKIEKALLNPYIFCGVIGIVGMAGVIGLSKGIIGMINSLDSAYNDYALSPTKEWNLPNNYDCLWNGYGPTGEVDFKKHYTSNKETGAE